MKVAIIGGGISGLTASLIVSESAEVTLYEKEAHLGGHANTFFIHTDNESIPVDTGFMVFNPPHYPIFVKLLEKLGVESVPTDMSFSVSIPGEVEYASHGISGLFANRFRFLQPSYYLFLREILRFQKAAKKALSQQIDPCITLPSFLSSNDFSGPVVDWYLFPMLAAIWSCPSDKVRDFPALSTFAFMNNHRLLDSFSNSVWHTIKGGSRSYVSKADEMLARRGARIVCSAQIREIRRSENFVTIDSNTKNDTYDYVILATHADTALKLLEAPTPDEREILGAFTYSSNETILHKDSSFMPERKAAWASWNYKMSRGSEKNSLVMTYNMNSLQHIETSTPTYVTLNPARNIPEDSIYMRFHYTHPHFNLAALEAQKRLPLIQGKNLTSYAGAHWGYGFHEDGARSGVGAAAALGFKTSWLS